MRLALDTGPRLGELRGLRWGPEGVDLDAGVARVTQAIDHELDSETLEYPVIAPKTKSPWRVMPLSPATV